MHCSTCPLESLEHPQVTHVAASGWLIQANEVLQPEDGSWSPQGQAAMIGVDGRTEAWRQAPQKPRD